MKQTINDYIKQRVATDEDSSSKGFNEKLAGEILAKFKTKLDKNAIRNRRRRMGLTGKGRTVEQQIDYDQRTTLSDRQRNSENRKYKTLLQKNDELKKELEASLSMKSGIKPYSFEYKVSKNDSEATAVVLMSDFHLEERVEAKTVNGLNNYDLNIAEKRVKELFQNTLKLVETQQYSVKIDTLIIALLGDIISSNIHDALLEINQLRPIEAIIFAENLVIGGIQYLLDNSKLNLVIPCHVGNHPRLTKKVHIATETGNNLETFMYHHLANHFKGNKRVKFLIADGYLSYLKIYDFTICFSHGHSVRYSGGVGGISICMNKAIAQWEKLKKADLYCMGHFHQFIDLGNIIVNGSVIGWNTYATFIKAGFEKPRQAFFLIDKKRNAKTVVCPIMFSI
jgi:hypothetical protein